MTRQRERDGLTSALASMREQNEFADYRLTLDSHSARVAAAQCLNCRNAPCTRACPTRIDVPGFIRKIAQGDIEGAAHDIFSANPLGGLCARVCPTDILCEGACSRDGSPGNPIDIAALQRHATDWAIRTGAPLFQRANATGRRIAVVGAGPAGLACAHQLAIVGHAVTLFEARGKPGGMSEYGIAAYKVPDAFVQREVDWLLSFGGIALQTGMALGSDISLTALRQAFDAVFLAIGLAGSKLLQIDGEQLPAVRDAVSFVSELRQADDLSSMRVGRRVVVVGGGNTALEAAVQCRKLGAESVTVAHRGGIDEMNTTRGERNFARQQGINFFAYARPVRILGDTTAVTGIEFSVSPPPDSMGARSSRVVVEADMVLKAIGLTLIKHGLDAEILDTDGARIAVDDEYRTSLPNVWAGGDCASRGLRLAVQMVQEGKLAAASIDRALRES